MNKIPYLNTMSLNRLKQLKNNTKCIILDPNTNKTKIVIFRRVLGTENIVSIGGYNDTPITLYCYLSKRYNSWAFLLTEKQLIEIIKSKNYTLIRKKI